MATDFTGLSGKVRMTCRMTAQKSTDLTTTEDILNVSKDLDFTFGTGASKVDQMFHDSRTLAASGSEELDLAGALTNVFGGTVGFADVKVILFKNTSTNAGTTLTIGNAAANQFQGPLGGVTETITIPANGFFIIGTTNANGWTVTAATADKLKVLNNDGANAATYDIILLGESS